MTKRPKSYHYHMVAIARGGNAWNDAREEYLKDRGWTFGPTFEGSYRWSKTIYGRDVVTNIDDAICIQRHIELTKTGKERTA